MIGDRWMLGSGDREEKTDMVRVCTEDGHRWSSKEGYAVDAAKPKETKKTDENLE